ncbi:MAG: response regulator, partial [Clostridia bacterium]|nr:response regulator [Clostridia bacterium]
EELPCDEEGYAIIKTTITDTGIGISEEFIPHLFDSFTRERNTTIGKVSGTGLGLSIVKKLVDLLGGTIEVKSEVGKGSSFAVTLKQKIADENQIMTRHTELRENDFESLRGKRILLAEDNDLNAEIAISILEEMGFEIEHAEDGDVCLDMLTKAEPHYYDFILMDIQMPNMDGYTATRLIRKMTDSEKANIPIIAMTANAFEEDKKNAFKAGMNGHVSKPIDVNILVEQLMEVIK